MGGLSKDDVYINGLLGSDKTVDDHLKQPRPLFMGFQEHGIFFNIEKSKYGKVVSRDIIPVPAFVVSIRIYLKPKSQEKIG